MAEKPTEKKDSPGNRFPQSGTPGVVAAEQSVALDRAGITVFRDVTFLAAGPASERSRSASIPHRKKVLHASEGQSKSRRGHD
jgi:hypothetical protein